MKISTLSLIKTNFIETFRVENQNKIRSEKSEGLNCVYFKLKNGTTEVVRDFYEYGIDNELISNQLCEQFWYNEKSIAYNPDFKFNHLWTGYIGSFSKFWDKIKLISLLRKSYRKEDLLKMNFVKKYLQSVDKEHHAVIIESILDEFNNSEVPIYGCKICGDKYCGTLNVRIEVENNVTWTFTDKEATLKWIFDKEQYELVLKTHMASIS